VSDAYAAAAPWSGCWTSAFSTRCTSRRALGHLCEAPGRRLWSPNATLIYYLLVRVHAEVTADDGGAHPPRGCLHVCLLYTGNFSPYRQRALDRLYVESGVYPSWRRGFGEALIANVRRAKIVVNMRNHDVPCEVKMARLMVLLSQHTCVCAAVAVAARRRARDIMHAHRFVVSERLGMPETEEHFSRGIVFVDSEDLAPTIVFYLRRPALRESIARSGFELFSAMPQWAALAEPVRAIEHARGCGA
jgi:hypothetical protein